MNGETTDDNAAIPDEWRTESRAEAEERQEKRRRRVSAAQNRNAMLPLSIKRRSPLHSAGLTAHGT